MSAGPRPRRLRRWVIAPVAVVIVTLVGWLAYVGYEGSRTLAYNDEVPHGCPTPAVMGWAYEAINCEWT
jgi:hypothetical protein